MKHTIKFKPIKLLGAVLLALLFSTINTAAAETATCTYTRGSGSDSIQNCKRAKGFGDWTMGVSIQTKDNQKEPRQTVF